MKRLFLMLLMVAGATFASAQATDTSVTEQQTTSEVLLSGRNPVTSKWTYLSGTAKIASHYLNNQEYTTKALVGIEASHGRFYRKSEHVMWKLTMSHVRSMNRRIFAFGLSNAAHSSKISMQNYEIDYATFYNWSFNDRLQIRVGGSLNLYGGFLNADDNAINNIMTFDLQTQLFAQAQIRYGWNFKKWGLDLYANAATPFIGFASMDSRYEDFLGSLVNDKLSVKEDKHFKFTSFHNLNGINFEAGIDFALRSLTISLGIESKCRWWNGYELQNYRKFTFTKVGISVNLFAQKDRKAINRQF